MSFRLVRNNIRIVPPFHAGRDGRCIYLNDTAALVNFQIPDMLLVSISWVKLLPITFYLPNGHNFKLRAIPTEFFSKDENTNSFVHTLTSL